MENPGHSPYATIGTTESRDVQPLEVRKTQRDRGHKYHHELQTSDFVGFLSQMVQTRLAGRDRDR